MTMYAPPLEQPDLPAHDAGLLSAVAAGEARLTGVQALELLREAPIHTLGRDLPPAKMVRDGARGCEVNDSMLSRGVVVAGATVSNSVISPGVRIGPGAVVEDSIVMDDAQIGPGAVVRRAIIDKHVEVRPGAQLGVDRDADVARYDLSDRGVVAVSKGSVVE